MKKKYYIDALNKSTYGVKYYDACSKPHSDAEEIAYRLGFEPKYLYGCRLSKLGKPIWKKVLLHAYNLCWQAYVLWQAHKLNSIKDSYIFLQYGFSTEAMFSVIKKLKRNGNRIILLIHDFDTFRVASEGSSTSKTYRDKIIRNEKKLIESVDVAIVHSKPMEERLRNIGYKKDIVILEFFDYLNDYKHEESATDIQNNIDIVFAGNLDKSEFVRMLHNMAPVPGTRYFLYGKYSGELTTNDNVIYKGVFQNDDIEGIEGTWGLVWDGDSTDTCAGNFGEYLKINAPFKLSLYLAKGLPVIVWKESAMAYYVEKYQLGITVNSLNDIAPTIRALSDNQLKAIKENIALYSQKVKEGAQLREALIQALRE